MRKLKGIASIWIKVKFNWVSIKVFNYLYRNPLSGMKEIIENGVNQRSTIAIMLWLDHKRIRHCFMCPHTDEHPLENTKAGWSCRKHIELAEKVFVERQKRAMETTFPEGEFPVKKKLEVV